MEMRLLEEALFLRQESGKSIRKLRRSRNHSFCDKNGATSDRHLLWDMNLVRTSLTMLIGGKVYTSRFDQSWSMASIAYARGSGAGEQCKGRRWYLNAENRSVGGFLHHFHRYQCTPVDSVSTR